jgi:hypothetical protein
MEEFGWVLLAAVLKYLVLVLASALFGFIPCWLLWNWLMPGIFGWNEINPLQSFGLIALVGFIFGSLNSWATALVGR